MLLFPPQIHCTIKLPDSLPPTFKGKSLRFPYELAMQVVLRVEVPMVLAGVMKVP